MRLKVLAALAACAFLASGLADASATTAGSAKSRRSTTAALSLITEPKQGIGPILDQVRLARRSVDVVMYELSDPSFEAALAADVRRGVKVRVLLNGGYYGAGGFPENDAAETYFKDHGVPVRAAPSYFALTHQKTIVIDDRVADVMTLNLTRAYYSTSRDFAVIDRQPRDVAAIEATFNADWSGTRIAAQAGTGDLVWSPGALASQLSLINSAHKTIEVYNEEMDDSPITHALGSAARRGVDVKVVMTGQSEWNAPFVQLVDAGVHVRTYDADASIYIHAKLILVDSRTAFLGSQNFSAGSLNENRELGIILSDPSIIGSLESTFASDYATAKAFASSKSPGRRPTAPSGGSGSCRVHASFSTDYHDWNVDVSGAPADTSVTATADGITDSWHTDSSGYADIYFKAPEDDAGATVTVTAGFESCAGTL